MALADIARALGRVGSPQPPQDGSRAHRVSVVIGTEEIGDWTDYEILNSMVEPADGFRMTRAIDKRAWDLCRLDERVQVAIDGVVKLDGFIDDRAKDAAAGTLEIAGRCKGGRLVQESIPTVSGFDGVSLVEAVRRACSPWFTDITLSNARNRDVARGKGHRASASGEPAFIKVKGKFDEDHAGKVDPGETRYNLIEQLCSSSGLGVWSTGDGRQLVIGQPNYQQAVQYMLRHSRTRGSTVKNMSLRESVRDGYALIEMHGTGGGADDDLGDAVSYFGTAKDGPNADGTGGDFIYPKRLVMAQAALQSNAEAARAAERHMKRTRFSRRQLTVDVALHGQLVAGTVMTLFAPDTISRVIDDDIELDESWLIYACTYRGSRPAGETTQLLLIPSGTEFVP